MTRTFWIAAAFVLLAGCAVLDKGPYTRNDGWRPGKVVEVAASSDLHMASAAHDCRKQSVYAAATPFATVAFRHNRILHYRAIPVPPGLQVKQGDAVRVNVERCSDGLVVEPNVS